MIAPNTIHHIAVATADMKRQIEFFTDVLGMELVGLFWMHGVEGAWHSFLKLGDASFSFVFIPGNEEQETVLGQTHAGNNNSTSAPGTMQHFAFNLDSYDDLLAMRDRIRSRGVPVFGPMSHGFCHSIYFAGPENLSLECATHDQAPHSLGADGAWIDPEVVELAGISSEELERFRRPAAFAAGSDAVPQPGYDPTKPHLAYPERLYQKMLQVTDEQAATMTPDDAPPSPGGYPAR